MLRVSFEEQEGRRAIVSVDLTTTVEEYRSGRSCRPVTIGTGRPGIYWGDGVTVEGPEPLEQKEHLLIDCDADDRPVAFEILQASEVLGGDVRVELELPVMSRKTS